LSFENHGCFMRVFEKFSLFGTLHTSSIYINGVYVHDEYEPKDTMTVLQSVGHKKTGNEKLCGREPMKKFMFECVFKSYHWHIFVFSWKWLWHNDKNAQLFELLHLKF
jgi:hypothetical protein